MIHCRKGKAGDIKKKKTTRSNQYPAGMPLFYFSLFLFLAVGPLMCRTINTTSNVSSYGTRQQKDKAHAQTTHPQYACDRVNTTAMMGGRGPIPCRFGVDCHRMDCWYSHPAGRTIDAAGGGGGANGSSSAVMPSTNTGRGAFGAAAGGSGGGSGGGGGGARSGMVPGGGMMPQASPRMGGGGGGGGNNECRFAFECKRRDCHFNHPFGEERGDGGSFVCERAPQAGWLVLNNVL